MRNTQTYSTEPNNLKDRNSDYNGLIDRKTGVKPETDGKGVLVVLKRSGE